MIIVSACLVGINCKYDGNNNINKKVLDYLKDKEYVLACPEQLGGLSTPRVPSEIIGLNGEVVINNQVKVMSKKNQDVTNNFIKGAEETLKIAKLFNVTEALLKDGSPSCGVNYIYNGSFSGEKISGFGVTTAILKNNSIEVKSEKDL